MENEAEIYSLLEEYISKPENVIPVHNVSEPEKPYNLIEDLNLLYYVYTYKKTQENNTNKALNLLNNENILMRSCESLKKRYDLLKYLSKEHFNDLFTNHLRHYGAEGYMNIEKMDGSIVISVKNASNKKFEDSNKKQKNSKNSKNMNYYEKSSSLKRKMHIPCEICERNMTILSMGNTKLKKIPVIKDEPPMNLTKKFEITRDFVTNKRSVSQEIDEDLANLRDAIELMKAKYNKSSMEIIEICEKTSGIIKDVEEFLKTNDEKLLWSEDDDMILFTATSKDDLNFKLLIRYKGLEKVKKRVAFKEIEMPFEL